jgi:hypothetical protein
MAGHGPAVQGGVSAAQHIQDSHELASRSAQRDSMSRSGAGGFGAPGVVRYEWGCRAAAGHGPALLFRCDSRAVFDT